MTWNIYDTYRDFRQDPANGAASGTFKLLLLTSAYTLNINTHQFLSDVIANEVSGNNYTARGNAVANITVNVDGSGNLTFDADDPAAWAQDAGGFNNARYGVLAWDTGVDATSRLFAIEDFVTDKGNVNGPFAVSMSLSGIYTQAR